MDSVDLKCWKYIVLASVVISVIYVLYPKALELGEYLILFTPKIKVGAKQIEPYYPYVCIFLAVLLFKAKMKNYFLKRQMAAASA